MQHKICRCDKLTAQFHGVIIIKFVLLYVVQKEFNW